MDTRELRMLPPGARGLVRFACSRMLRSYKPVILRILLGKLPRLVVPMQEVTGEFVSFYRQRQARGLPIERRPARFVSRGTVDAGLCARTCEDVLRIVIERSGGYARTGDGKVELRPSAVWREFESETTRQVAEDVLRRAIDGFYDRIVALGEAVYGHSDAATAQPAHELVFSVSDTDDRGDVLIVPAPDRQADR